MRRLFWVGLIPLIASIGCIANRSLSDAAVSDANVSNLSRISLGMRESEVLGIMQTPYKQEVYRVGEDTYHVWLYITTPSGLGQSRMLRKNITPLTFRNYRLIAVGHTYYHWLKNPNKPQPTHTTPADQETEDQKLERSLKEAFKPGPPAPSSPPTPQAPLPNPTSMSSPPPKAEPPKDPPPKKDPPPSNKPEWNEEDERRIQEESDQNFNFW